MSKGLYHTGATDLHHIFLTPLEAVIEAEILLAQKIKDFVLEAGFDTENECAVRTVQFTYTVQGKKKKLAVPVLTLITLPLLSIKDAQFNMHINMLTVPETVNPLQSPSLMEEETPVSPPSKVALKGYLSPKSGNDAMHTGLMANMKVKLQLGEAPLPGGLIKLLAMLNNELITEEFKENKNEYNK